MGGKGSGGYGGRKPLPKDQKKKKITILFDPWFIKILENCGIGYRNFIQNMYTNSLKDKNVEK